MTKPTIEDALKRGAQLGKDNKLVPNSERHKPYKFYLVTLKINSQGYDHSGAYWGLGLPLYYAQSDCGKVELFFRHTNRQTAKDYVLRDYPNAKFYR